MSVVAQIVGDFSSITVLSESVYTPQVVCLETVVVDVVVDNLLG